MSETTAKLSMCQVAAYSIGDNQKLDTIDDTTILGKQFNKILEPTIKYLMTHDWYFNRERKLLSGLTQVHKLEVDSAPSPANFTVAATLTGASSGSTSTIKKVLSSTVYLITEPSADYTDGEILSDGTNSLDCASGYPDVDENTEMGEYPYVFTFPSDYLYNRGISSKYSDEIIYKTKREGDLLLSQVDGDFDGYYRYNRFIGASGISAVEALPEWFHRLISARLAFVLSANITENLKIRPKAELDYQTAWLEAKEANGMESNNNKLMGEDNWNDSVWSEIDYL